MPLAARAPSADGFSTSLGDRRHKAGKTESSPWRLLSPPELLGGSPRDRETPATRRPPKRSERSVQTCARVCQGLSRGSWVRGARSPASAPPPTPTCAAARRPACSGRPGNPRNLFRVLPLTAAGRHTHQIASPVAETFPPELPFGFWLAPGSRARAVPPVPPQPPRARTAGGAPTYPERGARAEGAAHARALSPARCSRGAARPRGIAPRPGAGLGGLGLGLRAPAPARLGAHGLAVERRAPPRPARLPRGLRAASAAPPGQGKDDVGLGAGVPGRASPCPARDRSHSDPKYFVCSPPPVRSSRSVCGPGGVRSAGPPPPHPDPFRPPSMLVAPTPRQGLARRPGGAGKSRPPPPTSLVRHRGSRARAPRTPRAPRLAPRPARPPAGRAPPRGPPLRPERARAIQGLGAGRWPWPGIAGPRSSRGSAPGASRVLMRAWGLVPGTSQAGCGQFPSIPKEYIICSPQRPKEDGQRVERRLLPAKIHKALSRSPGEG
ncbi:basic proline-rich protein-like [Zalophus californianus]|uniref:Basic proline-rich protein-like n=1 Tax=Zalophus californianus TaxID=9704 RepID=A0A6J2CR72_ZALCA|nr:basic proline-rich protein-like [Zalophus californianus]